MVGDHRQNANYSGGRAFFEERAAVRG